MVKLTIKKNQYYYYIFLARKIVFQLKCHAFRFRTKEKKYRFYIDVYF